MKTSGGKGKYILLAILIIVVSMKLNDNGENSSAARETESTAPKSEASIMEEVSGTYKRISADGGTVGKFLSGVVRLFGDVTLTLDPDGTGLLDFRDIPGSYDNNYEYVTWDADNTIRLQGEDCTWSLEGDTLYIKGPDTDQEFERMD